MADPTSYRASFTRQWKHPEGYKNLVAWQNAALLRVLIRKFTATLPFFNKPLSPLNPPLTTLTNFSSSFRPSEHRLVAQLNDAARSFKRNIEEGYKRPSTKEYLDFLGFSQASLEEVKGDLRDCRDDGFLKSIPGSLLKDIGLDLSAWKGWSQGKDKGESKGIYGEPTEAGHPYFKPLQTLQGNDLTFEMFLELINKADWILRKLVLSLEQKMDKSGPMSAREQWLKRKIIEAGRKERELNEGLERSIAEAKKNKDDSLS